MRRGGCAFDWLLVRLSTVIALAICAGCLPSLGMLGENFPPHDIAFVNYVAPEFPYRLRATPVGDGYAIVIVTVGDDGRVDDAVIAEASHEAFGEAVLDVMPAWVFRASGHETLPRREVVHYMFRRSGVATSMSHREGARVPFARIEDAQPAIRMVSADVYAPVRIDEGRVSLPREALPATVQGSVDVSFVIDERGQVRVAAAAGTSEPALADAALAVVRTWRYLPPRYEDEPVLVEVVRTLNFAGDEP